MTRLKKGSPAAKRRMKYVRSFRKGTRRRSVRRTAKRGRRMRGGNYVWGNHEYMGNPRMRAGENYTLSDIFSDYPPLAGKKFTLTCPDTFDALQPTIDKFRDGVRQKMANPLLYNRYYPALDAEAGKFQQFCIKAPGAGASWI